MIALAVGAFLLFGALFLMGRSETPLERSVTGFNGLTSWLRDNDVQIINFKGGAPLVEGQVDLRILPLFDTNLGVDREIPEDRESLIAQTSEKDLSRSVVRRKIRGMPTLVILPKWRTGARALGVVHKDLLIPPQEINRLLSQIGLAGARVGRDAEGFTNARTRIGDGVAQVGLMHAQTVAAAGCTVEVTYLRQPLLLLCGDRSVGYTHAEVEDAAPDLDGNAEHDADSKSKDRPKRGTPPFWVLTDPDVANNHGLPLAENGAAMLAVHAYLGIDGPAILDTSDRVQLVREGALAPQHERTWEDVTRVFAWPFAMIWIAFLILSGLVFWRAVTRYGPVARSPEEEPMAAKTTSIDAKARLLRLANHDAALLTTHFSARLNQLAAELLGPHRPAGKDPLVVVLPVVRRANAELAAELSASVETPGPSADLLARLDRFENCYDRIRNEFGRATGAG